LNKACANFLYSTSGFGCLDNLLKLGWQLADCANKIRKASFDLQHVGKNQIKFLILGAYHRTEAPIPVARKVCHTSLSSAHNYERCCGVSESRC